MCPCPDFNCASCFGLASPMDGTDKMEVEFGDEKETEGEHPSRSIYRSHDGLVDVEDQFVK